MALITRCPVCDTRFKVVPDQLRISDGWVRCGQCSEVFDASAELSQSEGELSVAALPGVAEPMLNDAPSDHFNAAPVPETWARPAEDAPVLDAYSDWQPAASAPADNLMAAWPSAAGGDPPDTAAKEADAEDDPDLPPWDAVPEADVDFEPPDHPSLRDPLVEEVVEKVVEDDGRGDEQEDDVSPSLAAFPADMSTLPEDTVYVVPPPAADVDAALAGQPVSFLQEETETVATVWQRPWVRRSLMVLMALLMLGLAAQAAVQQRDRLAAHLPAIKPFLQSLCVPVGCTVQPLRQIEAIVIDSSTFTTLRHGVYRLNVVLKNRAATEIAVPAIELALTDTQEQPVLRRVLQPLDMLALPGASGTASAVGTIAPDAEWTASMELSVADEASITRIVGYRLLAFYP